MIYSVAVIERATREMKKAASWLARERSAEQAMRWYQGKRRAIAGLAQSPKTCAPRKTRRSRSDH